MDKYKILELLDELYDEYQSMREEGEHDMRTVLSMLDFTTSKIKKILAEG